MRVLKENHVAATNFILNVDDRDKFAEALDQEWPGPVPYTLLSRPGARSFTARPARSIRSRSSGPSSATSGGRTEL